MRYTPEFIYSLHPREVFVFGSNTAGHHGGGAAAVALKFGAEMGVGVGLRGQTYAIPTMSLSSAGLAKLDVSEIRFYVEQFLAYAVSHPFLVFLVTRIGLGIAGFRLDEIAPLFRGALGLINVVLPEDFHRFLSAD